MNHEYHSTGIFYSQVNRDLPSWVRALEILHIVENNQGRMVKNFISEKGGFLWLLKSLGAIIQNTVQKLFQI